MTKFIILRHGYSIYNKAKKYTGQSDIPLDETGVIQAEAAGKYIAENYKIDKIYSSDLERAVNTAKPAADLLGLGIETRADLRELNVGKWQDMEFSLIKEKYPEEFSKHKENPYINRCGIDGENYTELMERAVSAFTEMAEKNEGKCVLVATHGGLIKVLMCFWQNIDNSRIGEIKVVNNASVTEVIYDNGKAEFLKIGYDNYLTNKTDFTENIE